jgi:hypothetical protein
MRLLRNVLLLRGVVVIVAIVLSVVSFADGDTFLGGLFAAMALTNVGLIVFVARRAANGPS